MPTNESDDAKTDVATAPEERDGKATEVKEDVKIAPMTFWEVVLCLGFPFLTLLCISAPFALGLSGVMPFWVAIPLGLFIGVIILAGWISAHGDLSSVSDINISCAILWVLILMFSFIIGTIGTARRKQREVEAIRARKQQALPITAPAVP